MDAKTIARLIFVHTVKQYGILSVVISDRDPKFTCEFWSELMLVLGVKVAVLVSLRAQVDGQSEHQIRTLEGSLHCMVSHHSTNWHSVLPFCEYAHATCVATSSYFSHFEVNTERKPCHSSAIGDTNVNNGNACSFAEKRVQTVTEARTNMIKAQRLVTGEYSDDHAVTMDFASAYFCVSSELPTSPGCLSHQ